MKQNENTQIVFLFIFILFDKIIQKNSNSVQSYENLVQKNYMFNSYITHILHDLVL